MLIIRYYDNVPKGMLKRNRYSNCMFYVAYAVFVMYVVYLIAFDPDVLGTWLQLL